MLALKIIICIALIWIALGLFCALRVGRQRRTGASQVVPADPFFIPFGEMPIVPIERHLAKFVMTSSDPPPAGVSISRRICFPVSAGLALRPEDAGGRGYDPHGPAAARKFFAPFLRALR